MIALRHTSRAAPRAFTVLELLVAFAIIAVLAAIVLVAVKRGVESARATACAGHLRQLGTALSGYLGDNNNMMPELAGGRASKDEDVPVVDTVLGPYVQEPRIFACPADRQYAAASGTSYYWNVALNGQAAGNLNFFNLSEQHGHIPVLSDKAGFHPYTENKVNILYADGHTSRDLNFTTEK